jgi:hypothetical protein
MEINIDNFLIWLHSHMEKQNNNCPACKMKFTELECAIRAYFINKADGQLADMQKHYEKDMEAHKCIHSLE